MRTSIWTLLVIWTFAHIHAPTSHSPFISFRSASNYCSLFNDFITCLWHSGIRLSMLLVLVMTDDSVLSVVSEFTLSGINFSSYSHTRKLFTFNLSDLLALVFVELIFMPSEFSRSFDFVLLLFACLELFPLFPALFLSSTVFA